MKYLLLIVFLSLPFAEALPPGGDEIKWTPNEKLKWSDFKKKIDKGIKEYATLTGGIDCNFKQENDTSMAIVIFAYYERSESGKIEDYKSLTDEILRHEQGHFDIWEWYARILRKKLMDTTLTKFHQVMTIYNQIHKQAVTMQDKYDQETYVLDEGKTQLKWDSLIAEKLNEYSAFSNSKFRIHIRKK